MGLLIEFLIKHLVPCLEHALMTYEPEEQQQIVNEIDVLATEMGHWLAGKILTPSSPPPPK